MRASGSPMHYQSHHHSCKAETRWRPPAVPGFADAIRGYILGAVNSTCQKVARSTLAEYLRLDGDALDKLVPASASGRRGQPPLQSTLGKLSTAACSSGRDSRLPSELGWEGSCE